MALHSNARRKDSRGSEAGYIMLTLLLIIALMAIFAAAIVPTITFEIRRDREEEMIHRGVQYSRAIRAYYKKFGRYPTKIEDLESANNLRFLRKRYKDPITGKDFKLLHFGEVKLTLSGGIGGGTIPGASPIGAPGGLNSAGGFGQTSSFGANGGFGGNSNTAFGQNQPPANQAAGADSAQAGSASSSSQPDSSQSQSQPGGADQADSKNGGSGDQLAGVTFGGGPIVGVASSSKKESIREFNHKRKYNEWQFIYDPATDRGALIMTPNQPLQQAFGQQGVQNVNGQSGSSFGTGLPPAGMQNNPNLPATGGVGTPEPGSPPPQQQ